MFFFINQDKFINRMGGHDLGNVTLYIMENLFTKELAAEYSLKGLREKLNFSALKMCSNVTSIKPI